MWTIRQQIDGRRQYYETLMIGSRSFPVDCPMGLAHMISANIGYIYIYIYICDKSTQYTGLLLG